MSAECKSFFGCVNIYRDDYLSVAQPHSLVRTAVISFVCEFLNRRVSSAIQRECATTDACSSEGGDAARLVTFVDPSVVQCMVGFNDAAIGPLDDIRRSCVVVFPVTTKIGDWDATSDAQQDGGHWSLVVLLRRGRRDEDAFSSFAIDSCGKANQQASHRLMRVLTATPIVGVAIVGHLQYVTKFPLQTNQYDCGVMISWAMWTLANTVSSASADVASPTVFQAAVHDAVWHLLQDVEWNLSGASSVGQVCLDMRKKIAALIDSSSTVEA